MLDQSEVAASHADASSENSNSLSDIFSYVTEKLEELGTESGTQDWEKLKLAGKHNYT